MVQVGWPTLVNKERMLGTCIDKPKKKENVLKRMGVGFFNEYTLLSERPRHKVYSLRSSFSNE
jgi:hypothetical protein